MATGLTGSLAIRAVQASADGTSPAGDTVAVHLFHQNQVFRKVEAKLDEFGLAIIGDLPVAMGIRPVIQIQHAGVTYQETGPPMDASAPNAAVDVTVYDVTDDEPEWRIARRDVMASPAHDTVRVSEMLIVENPADRTWLGGAPNESGNRTTVSVELPSGARGVQLVSGFHGWCCTTFTDRVLRVQMPLMPGQKGFRFAYEIPNAEGHADVGLSAPVGTDHLAVMFPSTVFEPSPRGLNDAGIQQSDAGAVHVFEGHDVAPAAQVGVVLTVAAAPPQPVQSRGQRDADLPLVPLIGGGVVLIVVVAGVVIIGRARSAAGR